MADDGMTTIETIKSNQISINDAGQMAFVAEYAQSSVRRDGIFLVQEDVNPAGCTWSTSARWHGDKEHARGGPEQRGARGVLYGVSGGR